MSTHRPGSRFIGCKNKNKNLSSDAKKHIDERFFVLRKDSAVVFLQSVDEKEQKIQIIVG